MNAILFQASKYSLNNWIAREFQEFLGSQYSYYFSHNSLFHHSRHQLHIFAGISHSKYPMHPFLLQWRVVLWSPRYNGFILLPTGFMSYFYEAVYDRKPKETNILRTDYVGGWKCTYKYRGVRWLYEDVNKVAILQYRIVYLTQWRVQPPKSTYWVVINSKTVKLPLLKLFCV